MEITYRKAIPGDASVIRDFQLAMALETENMKLDSEICQLGVEAVFTRQLGQYFVCIQGQEIVGSVLILTEWSDWRNGSVWWIHSLYVKPEFRGRGVYRGLYNHVKNLAQQDPHVRGIRLYVDRRNQAAQAVYTKLGMDGEHYQLFEWMKS